MLLNLFVAVLRFTILILFFLVQLIVLLADVLDELDDGLVVVVVNAVFDLFVVKEGVEVFEKRFEQLGDTVLYDFSLQDFADNQLRDKFHITQNSLLEVFQKELFVLL